MMRRLLRLTGTLMIVAGVGTLAWALLVWQWQDPFTAIYTHFQQRELASAYNKRFEAFRPPPATTTVSLAAERRLVAREARRYRLTSHRGEALGRMRIPRLGLNIILVDGTDHESLKRGPGRYAGSAQDLTGVIGTPPPDFMPGEGQLVYVAGHRTTYLAPFSHIDRLRKGDPVTLELPYATFEYRISVTRIVPASDLAMLKTHGREVLVLQACHPRFFSSHRYLAYARPVRITPRGGTPFTPAATDAVAAAR
jgi:sortase A